MSCGISTSFPVLSPIRRQVAHALLTRPPLFRFRRSFTVRLECVMHAASVHPEPGSNSLKKSSAPFGSFYLFRAFFLLFLLFSFVNCRVFFESNSFFSSYSLLFNFQGPSSVALIGDSFILSHLSTHCQHLFCIFCTIFFEKSAEPFLSRARRLLLFFPFSGS